MMRYASLVRIKEEFESFYKESPVTDEIFNY